MIEQKTSEEIFQDCFDGKLFGREVWFRKDEIIKKLEGVWGGNNKTLVQVYNGLVDLIKEFSVVPLSPSTKVKEVKK